MHTCRMPLNYEAVSKFLSPTVAVVQTIENEAKVEGSQDAGLHLQVSYTALSWYSPMDTG